jgi:hypothetical protein
MAYQLAFEKLVSFNDTGDGIALEAEIRYSDVSVRIDARIDTGAAYSIFERRFGEQLGLDIGSGMRQRFGTATKGFYAYGFRVTLLTADLEFDSMVFFAEDASFTKNVLGRITWLDNLALGLVAGAGKIYLSRFEEE